MSNSSPLQIIANLDNLHLSLELEPPQRPDWSPTRHPPPPFRSGILSPTRLCSVTFLPVGSSVGSVDWPPIGSTLRPSGKNAEHCSGVGILKALRLPLQEADNLPSTSSTSRNPLNLPLPRILTSRPLIFGDLAQRVGVHGAASSRLINIAATGPQAPESLAPLAVSRLHPVLVSGSHHSAPSSTTPPGSPPIPSGGIGEHASNGHIRSKPEPPLPRLLPGLLDPILIRECELLDDDSLCASGKPKRIRRTNYSRAFRRPQIPTLDYGLPEDFSAHPLSGLLTMIVTLVRNSPRYWMRHH
ncbi:hypothetical protein EI94DRAFT_666579 [Lactarius quietus]|nr:hypothetical protein EI94DRAFT_666579 [Lactarius quietus]